MNSNDVGEPAFTDGVDDATYVVFFFFFSQQEKREKPLLFIQIQVSGTQTRAECVRFTKRLSLFVL